VTQEVWDAARKLGNWGPAAISRKGLHFMRLEFARYHGSRGTYNVRRIVIERADIDQTTEENTKMSPRVRPPTSVQLVKLDEAVPGVEDVQEGDYDDQEVKRVPIPLKDAARFGF